MEGNSSKPEKSDPPLMHSSDHHHHDQYPGHQNQSSSKSYSCTFCKKGFSNAQALGGHMNIHRRDRAKLMEVSYEETISPEITTKVQPCDQPRHDASADNMLRKKGSDQEKSSCSSPEGKWIFCTESTKDDGAVLIEQKGSEELQKLPLFAETPFNNRKDLKVSSDEEGGHVEKSLQFGHGSPQRAELDLELRLGRQRQES